MMHEKTIEVMVSDAPRPPWVGPDFVPDAVDAFNEATFETLAEMYDALGQPGAGQIAVLQEFFARAAVWGWDAAMNNGPMSQRRAATAATAAKKEIADATRRKILEAFDRAAKGWHDVSVDQIAKECGVSRATAYRHLNGKS